VCESSETVFNVGGVSKTKCEHPQICFEFVNVATYVVFLWLALCACMCERFSVCACVFVRVCKCLCMCEFATYVRSSRNYTLQHTTTPCITCPLCAAKNAIDLRDQERSACKKKVKNTATPCNELRSRLESARHSLDERVAVVQIYAYVYISIWVYIYTYLYMCVNIYI